MSSMKPIPYSVGEAVIEVAGKALHWQRSLSRILLQAGVPESSVYLHKDEPKFKRMRLAWENLEGKGEKGLEVQHNLVAQFANLDKADDKAPDPEAGNAAIKRLRSLAYENNLLVSPEEQERNERRKRYAEEAHKRSAKEEQRQKIYERFIELHQEENTQKRGYEFEKLLNSIFGWAELEFKGSYRTDLDQVDGAVEFASFTYLIEARWRKKVAVVEDLDKLTTKVERRLVSTRGLFISMSGFRSEVVSFLKLNKGNKLVLMDGQDLSLILEGKFDFHEALRLKVEEASIRGNPHLSLADL